MVACISTKMVDAGGGHPSKLSDFAQENGMIIHSSNWMCWQALQGNPLLGHPPALQWKLDQRQHVTDDASPNQASLKKDGFRCPRKSELSHSCIARHKTRKTLQRPRCGRGLPPCAWMGLSMAINMATVTRDERNLFSRVAPTRLRDPVKMATAIVQGRQQLIQAMQAQDEARDASSDEESDLAIIDSDRDSEKLDEVGVTSDYSWSLSVVGDENSEDGGSDQMFRQYFEWSDFCNEVWE